MRTLRLGMVPCSDGHAAMLMPPCARLILAPSQPVPQDNSFKQDAAFFVGVVALFYVLVQAWFNLFSEGSGGGGGGAF